MSDTLAELGVTVVTSLVPQGNCHHAWARSLRGISAEQYASYAYALPACAVVCSQRPVGVDIEPIDRPVSAAAETWMAHRADDPRLAPIARWCIKEAAFKAAPAGTTLRGYRLSVERVPTPHTGRGRVWSPSGTELWWRASTRIIDGRHYQLAAAGLRNTPDSHHCLAGRS